MVPKLKIGTDLGINLNPGKNKKIWLRMKTFQKIPLAVILFTLVTLINLYPQEDRIQFSHLTTEEGLSYNNVTQILQDTRGFLWISTFNGLNRYDGYNVKVFLPENSNPKSISSQSINTILEDNKGFIWVATTDGLNIYDWRTEQFYRYKNNPGDPYSISNNLIYSIFEDKSGTLWIGTLNGLNKYNRKTHNFTVIKKVADRLNPDSLNSVVSIQEDYKGNLWLGTWNGLTIMQKNGKIIKTYFSQPANAEKFEYRKISIIFRDNLNNLWIGMNGKGLKKFNPQTEQFTDYYTVPDNPNTISNGFVTAMFQDKTNKLWIGTRNGLNLFDPKKNSFIRIYNDPQRSSTIISNQISSINQDKSGILWVGTQAGISRFYQPDNNFYYFQEIPNHPDKGLISSSVMTAFVDKKNNIWVGTLGGLDEIKNSVYGRKIIHFTHDPQNVNSLCDNFIRSVFVDNAGMVWIGTNNDGLNSYDPKTGKFKLYTYQINDTASISNKGITSICQDNYGSLWFGTWWGLNKFNKKTMKFTRYLYNPSNPHDLRNNLIWDIYADTKGMLWIGTDGGGVSELNPLTNKFTNFSSDPGNKNYISNNRVFTIFESHDGIMWFGTIDGLNSYNRKTGKTIVYGKKDGLPDNLINGIQEDDKGYLWIATGNGLSKLNRKTGKFINFNRRNGIENLEFIQNIAEKSGNGTLYFGSNGLMYFNPDSIKDEYLTSPVVFTDLKIYNKSIPISENGILTSSIEGAKKINIPPGKDVLTLDFALLDFGDVKRNTFRYKLKGFDIGWNNVGTRNSATYTNLPPGEYTFEVKATNNNGVRNEKEASLKIVIIPAYYQAWWFKLIVGFVLLLFTLLIINGKTWKIKKHNKRLENMVNERTKDLDKIINEISQEVVVRKKAEEKARASLKEKEILLSEKESLLSEKEILLKEIHHRVKNNLQVISSLLYLNSKKIKDKEVLDMFTDSRNRVKSIALVHERLYRSKDLGKIDFNEYVLHLTTDLFKSYAVNPSIIKLNLDINNIFINIDFAVPCGLIINELISNSLKYAFPDYGGKNKEGLIEISFNKTENNAAMLIISDNGVGMEEGFSEKKRLSLGLQLVDRLTTQLEGTLKIDSSNGTTFEIEFPNFQCSNDSAKNPKDKILSTH